MIIKKRKYLMASLLLTTLSGAGQQVRQRVSYVNPFIGASTSIDKAGASHGLGKTFPGATTPYGMVQVSPNTITGGDNGSGYSYEHTSIEGFAFTQLSGIGWYGDLGNFLVMPSTGALKTSAGRPGHQEEGYRSAFAKQTEAASPGYYQVLLSKYQVKAEMTAAPHSGLLRFTFPANNRSRIQIDLARRVGGTSTEQYVRVVDEHTIEGWMKCTPDGGGWGNGEGHANYTVYFYAQFSKPLKQYGVWSAAIPDDWKRKREDIESQRYQQLIAAAATTGITKQPREQQGKHLGFFTEFATKENEQVLMKAGISFTDAAHAKMNLEQEITGWDFDKVHNNARALWNQALEKIKIEGGTEEEQTVFYTALYHTMIDPRIVSDVDGAYTGGDGKIHPGKEKQTRRTVFSGWDVFRSQMPLQTIINPSLVNDLLGSLTDLAGETGRQYFERWELLNAYSGCMIGNPAVSVLADAYAKGIRNYDLTKAYAYARNSCERFGNGDRGWTYSADPEDHRRNSYGNSPFPVSNTLENAYAEWCLSQLAAALGKKEDEVKYAQRALSYKNVFDAAKHWFRPRKEDGSWEEWPAEGRLKQFYGTVESNPYQQGWFVPHDVPGMVQLMGGKDSVITDLLHFFNSTPANLLWNDYYNHANEPVHHVPFLFNRLNVPWLTQEWSRKICARAYHNKVEGLVGNEDVGQMSAWYVLAASGLHPVCPGDTRYEITSPVFAKIEMQLDPHYATGKNFTVIAKNNSATNVYIQRASLNGQPYDKSYLDHADIAAGGVLELEMGPTPNKNWGAATNYTTNNNGWAELQLGSGLQDSMVVQQNRPLTIWGQAPAGKEVSIRADWMETPVMVKADDDGNFSGMVHVPAVQAGDYHPHSIEVREGGSTVTLQNVLIGELWLCSGQSNMQFSLKEVVDSTREVAAANYSHLRLLNVALNFSATPVGSFSGKWMACRPATVKDFSAVGYYFGRELQQKLNVPVGIIFSGIGASAAQAYVPQSVLAADTMLNRVYLQPYLNSPRSKEIINGGFSFEKVTRPFLLYNAMIYPLRHFSIRGVCWYQGESNRKERESYTKCTQALITSWRQTFEQNDLPFYYVQVAPYFLEKEDPTLADYAFFREAQEKVSTLNNTAMITTIDVGEARNLHPHNKKPIGIRLAKTALNRTYGLLDVVACGPQYQHWEVSGKKAIIYFEPGTTTGGLHTDDGSAPTCFLLAGADQQFYPAEAAIEGDKVIVWSNKVKKPAAVRYAFTNYAVTSLHNGEGWPVIPFRTDNWAEPIPKTD
ncbi:MAG: GH92 family glycosyl hydrolase [Niastella sp.]|uniref:GH92 family glycosyl hydrolase n=1 Tax=Niastella sp. TaxID=1869183 RepID=UPI00389A1C5E